MTVTATTARRHALGILLVWLFVLTPSAVGALAGAAEVDLVDVAFVSLVAVLVPLVLALGLGQGERRGLSSGASVALGYGLAALVSAGVVATHYALVGPAPDDPPDATLAWTLQLVNGAYVGVAIVGVWGMFMVLPRAVRDARERERERAALRRETERARVRSALEPHFVLNTLNAISGLVTESPETARDLVGDLGDLLRDVVRLSEADHQPVSAELAWLERYARILAVRHPGRLTFAWHLDADAAGLPIPVLLLQPLLENAIQHGALRRPGGGTVTTALARDGQDLVVTITDDGPGLSPPAPTASAPPRDRPHGLELTRRRLACDAPGSSLDVTSDAGGTRVTLRVVPP